MILVDSSVWIDFLHRRETPQTEFLKHNLKRHRLSTADLVLAEVLQGMRDDATAVRTEQLMMALSPVIISDHETAAAAARNFRLLRTKGITIRKTIDTLIATRCILDLRYLLFSDRDFDPFVEHLGLRSALSYPYGTN